MASVLPEKDGWRAFVNRKGVRESKVFITKAEANAWAAQREHEILSGTSPKQAAKDKSLYKLLERFRDEVSPARANPRWEAIRINRFLGQGKKGGAPEFEDVQLTKLAATHISEWRDKRLKVVKPGTVKRDMTFLSTIFSTARTDWLWLAESPMGEVKQPPAPRSRDRVITDAERDKVVAELGFSEDGPILKVKQKIAVAFLIALETGMRAGEIRKCVVSGKVARLETTKNGDARDVPLSARARELFSKVGNKIDLNERSLDSMFRRARNKVGLSGFTFHDSRATACTRLARIVDVLTLSKIIGHRDLNSLLIYYREGAESIADRLG